ncbi:hypothetical protein CLV62_12036 [Dysgonomonas alginatilytica]|uniref:Uncharacterized protein n=1 Tax=Dysgonomonas alginatilytica TaxID=1605892 RepID=A0A2V3PNI6_9BACT|nr:hypothetical protein [Dysgonomonas alginatilytica]PXV62348.1 hypothetical protein CLV62_12036 [Dysgonomonas alginatilytica]
MKKELLTIEFRYNDKPKNPDFSGYTTKTITIGIFDTLDEAIKAGNEAVKELAKSFEVRQDDKFQLIYLDGYPNRLVSNCCYSGQKATFYAKIKTLDFCDLPSTVSDILEANERYKSYKLSEDK